MIDLDEIEEMCNAVEIATTGYSEDCCWTFDRQHCQRRWGRPCPCICHEPQADHILESYCAPGGSCAMRHPCHRAGCTVAPDRHPHQP